jgi:putative oxidoreductase
MTIVRLAARPLLASMFFVGGLDAVRNAGKRADVAEPVTDKIAPLLRKYVPQLPEDPTSLVRINGAAQMGAAFMLATGRLPRISSAVLAATLVPTTAAGHRFWEEQDPQAKAVQRTHFFKNASMLGGLLLAAVDTEGKPGVAWRARRAASDVRREAGVLAKDARHQAKLAKAQLT